MGAFDSHLTAEVGRGGAELRHPPDSTMLASPRRADADLDPAALRSLRDPFIHTVLGSS